MFWHAAALEQVPRATLLMDADAAARALASAARLYEVDLVVAAPVDAVAWAIRGAAMPGATLVAVDQAHRSGLVVDELPSDADIENSRAVRYVVDLIERLKAQLAGVAVAVAVPTGEGLAAALSLDADALLADAAVGAFLRVVGAAEPAAVIRFGEGERGGPTAGICGYYGIPLVEVTAEHGPELLAQAEMSFTAVDSERGTVLTTTREIAAESSPTAVAEALRVLRAEAM